MELNLKFVEPLLFGIIGIVIGLLWSRKELDPRKKFYKIIAATFLAELVYFLLWVIKSYFIN